MPKVHYDALRLSDIETDGYTTYYKTACGFTHTIWNPRSGEKELIPFSESGSKVTCKNCKRTKVYKNS